MNEFILTMLDTAGIQSYIFGSNRLQENIGGSELVYRVTTLWAFQALNDAGIRHNVEVQDWQAGLWKINDAEAIEANTALQAEVVYAGGGNTMLIFRTLDATQQFTKILTRRVLCDAPGLTLVVRHIELNWYQARVPHRRDKLLQQLAIHKQAHLPSTQMLGFGVSAVCESTGLAAARTNEGKIQINGKPVSLKLRGEETRLISREIVAKLSWRDAALQRLTATVGSDLLGMYEFPSDIDKLGRILGEESYVAVIHADGNNMGDHVKAVDQAVETTIGWADVARANRVWITSMRAFSNAVAEASLEAMKKVVELIVRNIKWDERQHNWTVQGEVPLSKYYLPFRPLVFGGDDVTFLCNGRLGLTLAAYYLRAFEQATAKRAELQGMFACAGVSIVKMHYPFARAYNLSEQLGSSAKKFVREEVGHDCSALDWHFATSGLSGNLSSIRRREYLIDERRTLLMRPVRLYAEASTQDGRYWEAGIERVIREFRESEDWKEKRNKVQGLRKPMRSGPTAVATYCTNYELPRLPQLLPGAPQHQTEGWFGDRCVYFDAVELLDHYVPLTV